VIFFCSSCDKAWQIHGSYLYEVSYQIADIPILKDQVTVKYLPFWVLQVNVDGRPDFRFFVPAFRYRRLKHLSDFARHLSRKQPSYTISNGDKPPVHGCYYDQEDAETFAKFVRLSLKAERLGKQKAFQEDKLSITDSNLTWFPFKVEGQSLVDPLTGLSLFQNLLL
jgi:hypothetical protein